MPVLAILADSSRDPSQVSTGQHVWPTLTRKSVLHQPGLHLQRTAPDLPTDRLLDADVCTIDYQNFTCPASLASCTCSASATSISSLRKQTNTTCRCMLLNPTSMHSSVHWEGQTDRHTDRQTTQASLGTELNTISDSLTKPMEGKTRALASRRSNVEAAQNRSHG